MRVLTISGILLGVPYVVCLVKRAPKVEQKLSRESSASSKKNPFKTLRHFADRNCRSHVFRNHDLSIRCQKCWSSFPNKAKALDEHTKANDCMTKASPTKYWMTEEQRRQVKGQRFMGNGDENWYHLFHLILPHVSLKDEQGNYIVSPRKPFNPESLYEK